MSRETESSGYHDNESHIHWIVDALDAHLSQADGQTPQMLLGFFHWLRCNGNGVDDPSPESFGDYQQDGDGFALE